MQPQKSAHKKIKLLITIVDRGRGKDVIRLCQTEKSTYHLSFMGRGTANSEILDYLGLGETEKDIVMSVVLEERAGAVIDKLSREFGLAKAGNGIAFTIPIRSVGGPITLQFISGLYEMIESNAGARSEANGR